MNLYERIAQDIQKQNFAAVDFELSREKMEKAAQSFMGFLQLPKEIKDKFFFMVDPNNRGSMVGYTKKVQDYGDLDEKEYFHYNEYAKANFQNLPDYHNAEVKLFLDYADEIYTSAKNKVSEILKAFEPEFPGIYDKFFPKDVLPHFYLRFLKYDVMGQGNFLAKGHYDRGACTLALAESAPGLRIGRTPETLKEVVHRDGQVLFMPALTFPKHTTIDFPPAWHDVVQTGSDVFDQDHKIARWAIVFFADTFGLDNPSWDEAHTPK